MKANICVEVRATGDGCFRSAESTIELQVPITLADCQVIVEREDSSEVGRCIASSTRGLWTLLESVSDDGINELSPEAKKLIHDWLVQAAKRFEGGRK